MRSRLISALLVAAVAAIAVLAIVSMLAEFTGKGRPGFDHLVGRVIVGAFAVLLIAVVLMAMEKGSAGSFAAGAELVRFELQFGLALKHEADARHSLVLDAAGRGHPVNLQFAKVASAFRDHGGRATGDLVSVAGYFKSLSPGRLVVLGGPGSGKTVLAFELQAQLLKSRSQDLAEPLPVLVDAASYGPGETCVIWLAKHLAHRYVLPEQAVAQLVLGGRILPIIDGIDELGRSGAAALITELNAFIGERESSSEGRPSFAITCRAAEYQDLSDPLVEATHVEVRTLTSRDVADYLRENRIEIPDELASVLTSPLLLSLAAAISAAGGSTSRWTDDFPRLPDETAVEQHLLSLFLAEAYLRPRHGRNWSLAQAERWLALIGNQMRNLPAEGYAWREVACAVPTRLLGLLSGAVTCLGLLATFTILGLTRHVFGNRVPLGAAIESIAAISVLLGAAAALLVEGVNSGSLVDLSPTVPLRVIAALGRHPVAFRSSPMVLRRELRSALSGQRQGKGSRAVNPGADLAQSRRRALIEAAVVGVTLGVFMVALDLAGVRLPRDATIVFVSYCAVVVVLCSPWGSFRLALAWTSARRELPYRLMDFLDDAHERGVLRLAGPRFEFRNYAVQRYFSDPARLPQVRQEIGELADWVLGNPEIRESYRYVGERQADIEQAVSSLATETILAGGVFSADSATRQAVLERVRVRLNEIVRRSAFETSLRAREAPGLGAATDPSRIILTRTMDDLARLIDRIPSASVGISGIRGIGKSTLIRWLCADRDASRRLPVLGIYVTAPVEYDPREFLVHLYMRLCKAVLADDRFPGRKARQHRSYRRVLLFSALVIAGTGLFIHHAVAAIWAHDQGDLWTPVAIALLTGALSVLVSGIRGMWHRRSGTGTAKAVAGAQYKQLQYQVVETTGKTGSLSGPFGLSFSGSRSRQVTQNQMTLPELVDSYRAFAALTVGALQEFARGEGPLAIAQVRLVVGIDEIDRIEDAGTAEKFLNDIKAVFGIPNCVYIAALSADALATFERRVVSTRTAFDTTFDTVIRIGPVELATARQVLERRAIGLPYPFIALCYVLSGGVPRELMRIARDIFDIRNDVRFGSSDEGAVPCSVIAPRVIIREMESLRQGLMPLATQLNVPGATELIGLLDDPHWPSGEMQDDLAKMTKVIGQRARFQDETGKIAAAAKICDGLAAATYFFLSVDELFRTQLDRIIADLKQYDANPGQDANQTSPIHLLARARTAIGVNPGLAVARVQVARKDCSLPDRAPVLLSQLPPDPATS
jgi:NACHT domain